MPLTHPLRWKGSVHTAHSHVHILTHFIHTYNHTHTHTQMIMHTHTKKGSVNIHICIILHIDAEKTYKDDLKILKSLWNWKVQ